MFSIIESVFISSTLLVALLYLCYLIILSYYNKKKEFINDLSGYIPSVSMIIPMYNEEKTIINKINNIESLDYPEANLEVIYVDGRSTDDTFEVVNNKIARSRFDSKVIREETRGGYNGGIKLGINKSKHDVLIFTDSASYYYPDTINELVKFFNDDEIGAVTGRQIVENIEEENIGPKLEYVYRDFYDYMRMGETRIDSTLDMKGEILAVRKKICESILPNLDKSPNACFDACVPYQSKIMGYRAIYNPDAKYFEYSPKSYSDRMIQQSRRAALLIGSMLVYRNMVFKKAYGKFATLIMPVHMMMYLVIPWIFFLGIFAYVLSVFINQIWVYLLVPLSLLFIIEKTRIFVISFLQAQIALISGLKKVVQKNKSLFIDTIPSTRVNTVKN